MDVCPSPFATQALLPPNPHILSATYIGTPVFKLAVTYAPHNAGMDQGDEPTPARYQFLVDGLPRPLTRDAWNSSILYRFNSPATVPGAVMTIQCIIADSNTRNTDGIQILAGPQVHVS